MPRTCLACSSPDRSAIEKSLVSGEPLRNIAKRVSISPAGLLRHKSHVARSIVKASERREEQLGDNLLDEMRRVQQKAWELLAKTESEGDHRASIVALREVRECLESLGQMLGKAANGSPVTLEQVLEARRKSEKAEAAAPLTEWTNDELKAELNRRGEEMTKIVIQFERAKDGKPCDCPCCTANRNERTSANKADNQDSLGLSP